MTQEQGTAAGRNAPEAAADALTEVRDLLQMIRGGDHAEAARAGVDRSTIVRIRQVARRALRRWPPRNRRCEQGPRCRAAAATPRSPGSPKRSRSWP